MSKSIKRIFVLLLTTFFALSGCAQNEKYSAQVQVSDEPVILKLYQSGGILSDTEFQRYFAEPVKRKHPNITLELVRNVPGQTPEELLTTGAFPDIIFSGNIVQFNRLGATLDLNPLVKKYGTDLEKFDPSVLEFAKERSKQGELSALPIFQNVGVLIYNKDLFDKFGLPYPADNMDWDQVNALARKLTRKVDGVQYIGYDQPNIHLFGSGLSLPYIDESTGKATVFNEGWKLAFQTAKSFYEIPGVIGANSKFRYNNDDFFKNKNLAMFNQWLNQIVVLAPDAEGINWDLAAPPNYKEVLGTGREAGPLFLMVSSTTKHPDQVYRVLSVVTGEEVQSSLYHLS